MRDLDFTRRDVIRLVAAGAALATGAPALAGERRIAKLVREAAALPTVSQRMDFISAALRGTRYRANTLVGGPRKPEQFVVRDDAFDCVTFLETVLAGAEAREPEQFEVLLRKIRYRNGVVEWRERNHYFFDWCRHNVDNGFCRWLAIDGAVEIYKTCDSQKGLGTRRFTMSVVPTAKLLANQSMLQVGDIIGFVSRRADLDYFHAGMIAFGNDKALLLRHAAESERSVLDERLTRFIARWRVRYVSLLRPLERKDVA